MIRPEVPADHAAICAVTEAAFLEAPHTSHTEQFIVAALREAGALAISLVAEADGAVAGHVAVSPVTIADGTQGWFGLGPVSVTPRLQGQGIGAQLVYRALDMLKEQGASGCVVLGDPSYYQRFGFRNEPGLVLPGIPPEYFMAISLGGSLPGGAVAYHPAFEATC